MKPGASFLLGLVLGGALTLATVALRPGALVMSDGNETTSTKPAGVEPDGAPPSREHGRDIAAPASADAATSSETDPAALVRQLAAAARPGGPLLADSPALAQWAAADPFAALEFLLDTPKLPGRMDALAVPISEVLRVDPAKAVSWMHEHLVSKDRVRVADAALRRLVEIAPHHAVEVALNLDIAASPGTFGYLLGTLASVDAGEASRTFASLPSNIQQDAAKSFTERWARADPRAALRWWHTLTDTQAVSPARIGLLSTALAQSPESLPGLARELGAHPWELLRFVIGLADSGDFLAFDLAAVTGDPNAFNTAATTLIEYDPTRTLGALRQFLSTETVAAILERALDIWRQSNRQAAETWLEALPDHEIRQALAERAAVKALREDPQQLVAYHQARDAPLADHRLESAISSAAESDPAAIAHWIADPSTPSAARNHLGIVVESWMSKDEVAAAVWINSLSDELKDDALQDVARWWTKSEEPEAAMAAIAAISQPTKRTQAAARFYISINPQHPELAEQWLSAQPFPEGTRELLRALAGHVEFVDPVRPLPDRVLSAGTTGPAP